MAKKKKDDDDETPEESSDGTVPVNDAWTGMLAISLLALIAASAFLGFDMWRMSSDKGPQLYQSTAKEPSAPAPVPKPQQPKADDAGKDKDQVPQPKADDAGKDKDKVDKGARRRIAPNTPIVDVTSAVPVDMHGPVRRELRTAFAIRRDGSK